MKKIILVLATVFLSAQVYAAGTKKVSCTARLSTLDFDKINKSEKVSFENYNLEPMSNSAEDKRSQLKSYIKFANGYVISIVATLSPNSSVSKKDKDLFILKVRLQKTEANNKITVLAMNTDSSESNSENVRPGTFLASVLLENPEVATAILNSGEAISAHEALKRGLIPNGTASGVSVICFLE